MLKILEYLAIGSAIAFSICLIVLMFFYGSPSAAPQSPQQQQTEENKALKDKGEAEKPFWEKATTDPVAAFTLFLVIFTAVLSAVGVIQLKMLVRAETVAEKTAQAAKDSAEIAKATLVSANRPWISAEFKIFSDLTFEAPGARLTIEYIMKNTGNTPAINITPYVKFMPLELGKVSGDPPNTVIQVHQTNPAAELQKLFEFGRQVGEAPFAEPITGDTIFPGGTLTDRVTVTLTSEEIDRAKEMSFHKKIDPIFLICLNYRSPLENISHQTGYIFYVTTHSPQHEHGIDPTKGNIPAGYLGLMRFPFRSSVAN